MIFWELVKFTGTMVFGCFRVSLVVARYFSKSLPLMLAAHLLKILQVIGHCDWEIIWTIWTTDSIEEYDYEIEISPQKIISLRKWWKQKLFEKPHLWQIKAILGGEFVYIIPPMYIIHMGVFGQRFRFDVNVHVYKHHGTLHIYRCKLENFWNFARANFNCIKEYRKVQAHW